MSKTILVVEDDASVAQLLDDVLTREGFTVRIERDGEWALRAFEAGPPDLVVSDVLLPKLQGFDLLPKLRQHPAGADVPIILLSGVFRSATYRTQLERKHRITAYFDKPLDVNELTATVREALGLSAHAALTPAMAAPAEARVEVPKKGDLVDIPFARLLGLCLQGRVNGALMLRRASVKKIVYFKEGYPVFVRSNLLTECLGRVMVSERLISQEECDKALELKRKEPDRRQGEILVSMGSISPHNLDYALELQMQEKLFEIFSWQEGPFQLNLGTEHRGPEVALSMSPTELVHEGALRGMSTERIRKDLRQISERPLVPSSDPTFRYQALQLDPRAAPLLDAMDGTRNAESLLGDAAELDDAARLIYALVVTGLLRAPAPPPLHAPAEEPETLRTDEIDVVDALAEVDAGLAAQHTGQAMARAIASGQHRPLDVLEADTISAHADETDDTEALDAEADVVGETDDVDEVHDVDARGAEALDAEADVVGETDDVDEVDEVEDAPIVEARGAEAPPPAPPPDDAEDETTEDDLDAEALVEDEAAAEAEAPLQAEAPRGSEPDDDEPAGETEAPLRDEAGDTEGHADLEDEADAEADAPPAAEAPLRDEPVDADEDRADVEEPEARAEADAAPGDVVAPAPDELSAAAEPSDEADAAASFDSPDDEAIETNGPAEASAAAPDADEDAARASTLPRRATGEGPTPAPRIPTLSDELRQQVRARLEAQAARLANAKPAAADRFARKKGGRRGLGLDLEAERARVEGELRAAVDALEAQDLYARLELGPDADADAVDRAFERLSRRIHPDRVTAGLSSADVRILAERRLNLLQHAYETLRHPEARARYRRRRGLERPPEDAGLVVADDLYARGLDALTDGDWGTACAAFGAAVERSPDEGVYRAHLAWATYLANPEDGAARDAALDLLHEATELNPRAEEAHLFAGRIHQRQGRAEAAVQAFQRALRCNPDCVEALDAVRELAPPPPKKTGLLSRFSAR